MSQEPKRKSTSRWSFFLLCFALLCFLLFCSLHMYGVQAPSTRLEKFFQVADKGSLQVLMDELSPALHKEHDGQLLALFIKEIVNQFGPYQKAKAKGFAFSKKMAAGHQIEQFSGTIVFKKREIPMLMQFVDGKLNAVRIQDDQALEVIAQAGKAPPNLGPYVKRGAHFFKWILEADYEKAYSLLSPFVKKNVSLEEFTGQFKKLRRPATLLRVSHLRADPMPGRQDRVSFTYECIFFGGKKMKARLTYQFSLFKSYLSAYAIPVD